jgi:hypothetical protein
MKSFGKSLTGLGILLIGLAMQSFIACPTESEPDSPSTDYWTVSFNTDGGIPAAIPAVQVEKGGTLGDQYPDDPEKNSYYFQGWFTSANVNYGPATPVNSDITLKARWVHEDDAELFTVTFDSNGGNSVEAVRILEWGILGTKYPTPVHNDAKYAFAGWFYNLGSNNEEEIMNDTQIWDSITVSAKWIIPDVTVTFDTDGGTPALIDPVTVKNGDPIGSGNFPGVLAKTGFIFRGWYKPDDVSHTNKYDADTPIFGNTTLKAYWVDSAAIPTYSVSFLSNHSDTEGFTNASPSTLPVPRNEEIDGLPTPPARSEGWGAGMHFTGWNTNSDGTGDTVTGDTVVSSDMTVYAQWEYQAGTPQVSGDTLVHYAPPMEISGTANDDQGVWDGTENADGSVTYAGGAVRYRFPAFSADYDINDYDFFTVHYVAKNEAGTTPITGSMLKQFTSSNSFANRAGEGAPNLAASGTLEFEIRNVDSTAAVKGLAIQNISDNSPPQQTNTIKWTKVVFSTGQRVQIQFVTGTDQTLEPIRGVVGTAVGVLPVAAAPEGKYLVGWKDAGGNTVTRLTIVTGPLTLTAEYRDLAAATTWRVDFNSLDMFTLIGPDLGAVELFTGASYTNAPSGWSSSGYKFYMGDIGWQESQVKFKVTLPADTPLSAYTSVTARVNAVQGGDNTYKNAGLVGGQPLPETFGGATPLGSAWEVSNTTSNAWTNNTARTMTYTINKANAAGLMGEIELCIYWHFPASTNSTPRAFEIYDVTFNP